MASRRVGSKVYTVVLDHGPQAVPGVNTSIAADDSDAVDAQATQRMADAERAVYALDDSYFVRSLTDNVQGKSSRPVCDCTQVLSASAAGGMEFTSLVSFDLDTLETRSRTMVASRPGFGYASGAALYLAADGVGGGPYGMQASAQTEQTTLHKFDLVGASTRYAGSARVDGHVLNQFSMDEQAGVLRVATSLGYVPDPDVSSSLTTFGMQAGKLTKLGASPVSRLKKTSAPYALTATARSWSHLRRPTRCLS